MKKKTFILSMTMFIVFPAVIHAQEIDKSKKNVTTASSSTNRVIILNWVINNFEYSPIFITFASIIKTSSK
jgi:hypothetical protein